VAGGAVEGGELVGGKGGERVVVERM